LPLVPWFTTPNSISADERAVAARRRDDLRHPLVVLAQPRPDAAGELPGLARRARGGRGDLLPGIRQRAAQALADVALEVEEVLPDLRVTDDARAQLDAVVAHTCTRWYWAITPTAYGGRSSTMNVTVPASMALLRCPKRSFSVYFQATISLTACSTSPGT
jgi:hypothetical protein